jgi:FMN reductase
MAPVTILGIGGTTRPGSTSERALCVALNYARARGAAVDLLTARELDLPMYDPGRAQSAAAVRLIAAARAADGIIVATPGYHGGMSGLLKNALDHLQELADDPQPYLHDRAVGIVVAASGWQAAASTLGAARSTVHALRGWPTPLGVLVNSAAQPFAADGTVADESLDRRLAALADQVVDFARARAMLVGSALAS